MREISSSTGTREGSAAYRSLPNMSGSIGTSSTSRRPSPAVSRSPARSKSCAWGAMPLRLATGHAPAMSSAGALQVALEHLAGRVARELREEHHVARHLEAGEVRLDVILHRRLAQFGAVAGDDEGLQALAELLVGDAHDGRLLDSGV